MVATITYQCTSLAGIPGLYLWVVVMGGINSFADACGIGMNDLANSFGTVYGSRVLNKYQIICIACVMEFAGAMALGKEVVSTVTGGITKTDYFKSQPYVMMYGFLCALTASTTWLYTATYLKLPVSTTHAVVGGIMGFSLAFGGVDAVNWNSSIPDFPYISGLSVIVCSWVTSPIFTGILAAIFYTIVKCVVLSAPEGEAGKRASLMLPFIVGFTVWIESMLIIVKAAGPQLGWGFGDAAWVGAIVGVGIGILSCVFIPCLRSNLMKHEEKVALGTADRPYNLENEITFSWSNFFPYLKQELFRDPWTVKRNGETVQSVEAANQKQLYADDVVIKEDVQSPIKASKDAIADVSDFEQYDAGAEYVFKYMQVFTACCASFAHGSNDVSNAAGPFAGIYQIYTTGAVSSKSDCPAWIIAISAGGICIGLATYGQKIMELLGDDLTFISPIRGFCAELASALVVTVCSAYGMPVSTTQSITGGIIGISLMDLPFYKLKWRLIGFIFLSWIMTILVTVALSAAIFSQGVFSPVKTGSLEQQPV